MKLQINIKRTILSALVLAAVASAALNYAKAGETQSYDHLTMAKAFMGELNAAVSIEDNTADGKAAKQAALLVVVQKYLDDAAILGSSLKTDASGKYIFTQFNDEQKTTLLTSFRGFLGAFLDQYLGELKNFQAVSEKEGSLKQTKQGSSESSINAQAISTNSRGQQQEREFIFVIRSNEQRQKAPKMIDALSNTGNSMVGNLIGSNLIDVMGTARSQSKDIYTVLNSYLLCIQNSTLTGIERLASCKESSISAAK